MNVSPEILEDLRYYDHVIRPLEDERIALVIADAIRRLEAEFMHELAP